MNKYIYEGPVYEFDTCVIDNCKVETMAPSEKKARSNFSYRFKKRLGLTSDTKIKLPGKITLTK